MRTGYAIPGAEAWGKFSGAARGGCGGWGGPRAGPASTPRRAEGVPDPPMRWGRAGRLSSI